MRGMILAAGRGERMGKLTAELPKPLLQVAGRYLIEYVIASFKRAGITEIMINVSYHAEQIKAALGDGSRYGVTLFYSEESERLETGGGIFKALPWLGKSPFLVMSSDIITDLPLEKLSLKTNDTAHLVMVENPSYHPRGDFGLEAGRILQQQPTYTFASIGVYHPDLFAGCKPGRFRLTEVLLPAILNARVSGELYTGLWENIGTEADLAALNQRAREDSNLRPLASETNTLSN